MWQCQQCCTQSDCRLRWPGSISGRCCGCIIPLEVTLVVGSPRQAMLLFVGSWHLGTLQRVPPTRPQASCMQTESAVVGQAARHVPGPGAPSQCSTLRSAAAGACRAATASPTPAVAPFFFFPSSSFLLYLINPEPPLLGHVRGMVWRGVTQGCSMAWRGS